MARVNEVKKSRKEQKCSGCGKIIPVGSPYKWIAFNYGPTVVRCCTCGFKPYETTSNEYLREVGRIKYEYEESINTCDNIEDLENVVEDLKGELETVRDELEEKRDNLPEQFQYSGPGEVIEERIDNLDSVLSDLENVDFDFDPTSYEDWLADSYDGWQEEREAERREELGEEYFEYNEENDPDYLEDIEEEEQEKLEELVDEVLGYLEDLEC